MADEASCWRSVTVVLSQGGRSACDRSKTIRRSVFAAQGPYDARMARRGAYAKGVAKREEILDAALGVIARNGYQRTSVREIAEAVGLSQAGLLHYFSSKEALFAEILRAATRSTASACRPTRRPESRASSTSCGTTPTCRGSSSSTPSSPPRPRTPTTPLTPTSRGATPSCGASWARRCARRRQRGELSRTLDAESVATILLAAADGLQTQWMLEPDLDMAAQLEHLWAALRRVP